MQCPINSRTTSEGAMNCICRNGYYRTDSDPLQMPCTSMFSFSNAVCELSNHFHRVYRHEQLLFGFRYELFAACILHPQAEEPRDQRMIVVYTALNRETLSELSFTQIYCWHAQSVSVHRSDLADKARLAFLYITWSVLQTDWRLVGQGAQLCEGSISEKSRGEAFSCHANEAVWIRIRIWDWHWGWEREWPRTDRPKERGNIRRKGNKKKMDFEGKRNKVFILKKWKKHRCSQ